jgi:hypothetical protein
MFTANNATDSTPYNDGGPSMYTITSPFGGETVVDSPTFTDKASSGGEEEAFSVGDGADASEIGLSTVGEGLPYSSGEGLSAGWPRGAVGRVHGLFCGGFTPDGAPKPGGGGGPDAGGPVAKRISMAGPDAGCPPAVWGPLAGHPL